MLGIAQICGSFTVTSVPEEGEPFRARVRLYDLAKAKMDQSDSELVHSATTETSAGEKIQGKIVDVGTYDFEEFDPERLNNGTRIVADDVTPTFTQAFQQSLRLDTTKSVPVDWRAAVLRVLRKSPSLQVLGDYWRLLWEISVAAPVPYLADDVVQRAAVRE